MTRRRLIKLAALISGGMTLPLFWLQPLRADTLFTELFGDAGVASHIGRLHGAGDPDAAGRGRRLVDELAVLPSSARGAHLKDRIRTDLEDLEMVAVDGWMMARAEADLCAAVYLDRVQA